MVSWFALSFPFPQRIRARLAGFPCGDGDTHDADGFPAGMETRVMELTRLFHSRRESVTMCPTVPVVFQKNHVGFL